jgi:hypothetical protein
MRDPFAGLRLARRVVEVFEPSDRRAFVYSGGENFLQSLNLAVRHPPEPTELNGLHLAALDGPQHRFVGHVDFFGGAGDGPAGDVGAMVFPAVIFSAGRRAPAARRGLRRLMREAIQANPSFHGRYFKPPI